MILNNDYFMEILIIIFFLFINLLTLLLIVFSITPIFSITYFILFFFINFFLLIFLNIEFLAVLFLVLYAGAVSILFIFVVLLFDIKFLLLYSDSTNRFTFFYCLIFFFFLIINFYLIKYFYIYNFNNTYELYINWFDVFYLQNELTTLGIVIFNYYYLNVFLLIFLLFITMIGIIILSLNKYSKIINGNFYNLNYSNFKQLLLIK